mgnify:CR=1 FL=1
MNFGRSYIKFILIMTFVHLSGFVLFGSTIFSDFNLIKVIMVIPTIWIIMFGFLILMNWVNNTVTLFFYRSKKYPIKTYNLYPFIFIKPNRIKLYFLFDPFVELYTTIAVEKIKWDNDRLSNYYNDYKSIISKIKIVHLIILIIIIPIGVITSNIFLSIFLGLILIGNVCIWNMPNSVFALPGMYMALKNPASCMHMMFRLAKVEVFDKGVLYNYAQKFIELDKERFVGTNQLFLEQIMIDSIYEKQNYLNAETEDFIYNLLMIQSGRKSPIYFKIMVLFAIYCLYKGEVRTANILYNETKNFCENLQFCPPEFKKKYENMVTGNSLVNFDIKEMASFDNVFKSYLDRVNWFKKQSF